jgi:hypothetical protein
MLIPEMFYGTYAIVKKRVRVAVTKVVNGESLATAFEAQNMLDTSSAPGLIYLGPPAKHFEQGENFHAYPLGTLVRDPYYHKKYSEEREEEIYQEMLTTEWGIVMLVSRINAQDWLRAKNRFHSFVKAFLQVQEKFTDLGERFEETTNSPESFWTMPHGVMYAVANLGIPDDEADRYFAHKHIPESILEISASS